MRDERLGNYRVMSRIGEGGMGTVYRAEHALLGRAVAIKVLQPELSQNPDMIDRFFNEARATAQLRHPGIVDVFDFGYCADGAAFIVMELLQGESLTSRLARDGRLAWPQACRFARQIAASLAAAHRAQIVHRDLKPDNVFLVREPDQPEERTKVLDFGIAKLAGAGARGSVKTRADLILGTPAYMSPQQCRGAGQVDHRADIYALGCIVFEMVCGRPPFVGEGLGELLSAHMMLPPPEPRGLAPELPDALEHLILGMLAKAESDRPPSMEAVAAELDAITGATGAPAADLVSPATTSGPSTVASRAAAVTTFGGSAGQVAAAPSAPSRYRRLASVFALAASLGMAGTVAAVLALRGQPTGPPAARQPSIEVTAPAPPAARQPSIEVTASAPRVGDPPGEPPPPPAPARPAPDTTPGPASQAPAAQPVLARDAVAAAPRAGTTPAPPEYEPQPVVHELACDPGCEIVLDGDVVGKAAPGSSYRAEFLGHKGQVRSYVLRPLENQHRATSYRAPADRSVKALVRLPCAPRDHTRASARPRVYDPYDSCNER